MEWSMEFLPWPVAVGPLLEQIWYQNMSFKNNVAVRPVLMESLTSISSSARLREQRMAKMEKSLVNIWKRKTLSTLSTKGSCLKEWRFETSEKRVFSFYGVHTVLSLTQLKISFLFRWGIYQNRSAKGYLRDSEQNLIFEQAKDPCIARQVQWGDGCEVDCKYYLKVFSLGKILSPGFWARKWSNIARQVQWEDGCEVENADCNFCKEGDKTDSTLSAVKSNVFFEKFKVKSNGKKSEVQRVLDFTFFTVGLHFLLKWSPTVKKVKSNGCWTSLFF